MLCGLELFPWPLLKSIFIVKEIPGAVFGIFWTSLDFAQSNFFAARWFLGSIKFRLWHFPETLQVRPCQSWAPP